MIKRKNVNKSKKLSRKFYFLKFQDIKFTIIIFISSTIVYGAPFRVYFIDIFVGTNFHRYFFYI
jgi:hypothetical protein